MGVSDALRNALVISAVVMRDSSFCLRLSVLVMIREKDEIVETHRRPPGN